jgi:hypothetical protein
MIAEPNIRTSYTRYGEQRHLDWSCDTVLTLREGRVSELLTGEIMPQGRLAGKVAIVTGAAPQGPDIGNGSAVAILFAREGAQVVLVNRSEERARELQYTIEDEGGDCMVCPADVTNATDVERHGRRER